MKIHRKTPVFVCSAFAVAAALSGAGCGGSGTSSPVSPAASASASRGVGKIAVSVRWPEAAASRAIPINARSLRVRVFAGETQVAEGSVARVEGQASATVTLPSVPAGAVRLVAEAFSDTPQGVALATGQVNATVKAGQTVTAPTLSILSTVAEVRVEGDAAPLPVGESRVYTARAYNNVGEVVLTAPGVWRWEVVTGGIEGAPNGPSITITGRTVALGEIFRAYCRINGDASNTGGVEVPSEAIRVNVSMGAGPGPTSGNLELDAPAGSTNYDAFGFSGTNAASFLSYGFGFAPGATASTATVWRGGTPTALNLSDFDGNLVGAARPSALGGSLFVVANKRSAGNTFISTFVDLNQNFVVDAGEEKQVAPGRALALSPNGDIVVGTLFDSTGQKPFRASASSLALGGQSLIRLATSSYPGGAANAVSANGTVAGYLGTGDVASVGAVWRMSGSASILEPVDFENEGIRFAGVNDNGIAVGVTETSRKAVYYVAGGTSLARALPPLPGAAPQTFLVASGINNDGLVVGYAGVPGGSTRAMAWRLSATGAVQEVIDLSTRSGINGVVQEARAVNNQGQILVVAQVDGKRRLYLLLP